MDFAYSSNPYAYFDASPYQLVVGSYLAATGVYLNSWQLLQVHLRENVELKSRYSLTIFNRLAACDGELDSLVDQLDVNSKEERHGLWQS